MSLNIANPDSLSPEQAIGRIFASGYITSVDRTCLLQATLTGTALSPDVENQVRRVFDYLRMGRLTVVD